MPGLFPFKGQELKFIAVYLDGKYLPTEMDPEYRRNPMDYEIGNPNPGLSGVDVAENGTDPGLATGRHLLVNLTVDRRFYYRTLYRLTSLALKTGGMLDYCNGQIAMFHFPAGGVMGFLEDVGYTIHVERSRVSYRDIGGSIVNVKFQGPPG